MIAQPLKFLNVVRVSQHGAGCSHKKIEIDRIEAAMHIVLVGVSSGDLVKLKSQLSACAGVPDGGTLLHIGLPLHRARRWTECAVGVPWDALRVSGTWLACRFWGGGHGRLHGGIPTASGCRIVAHQPQEPPDEHRLHRHLRLGAFRRPCQPAGASQLISSHLFSSCRHTNRSKRSHTITAF